MDNTNQINDNITTTIPKTTFWQLNLNKSKAATAHLTAQAEQLSFSVHWIPPGTVHL